MMVRELYKSVQQTLESGGVENAAFEAEQLLQSVGIDKLTLLTEPNAEVSEDILREISARLERRIRGEPLQYILGEWEFCGLPFKVGEGVLIPRQDTETLVETAARFLKERDKTARRTLDLCAGSGCIGIALAKTAGADVICVEKSLKAFGYLEENIAMNDVSVKAVLGDVLEAPAFSGEFDLIVSNPPYLTESDMRSLQREVEFEPKIALFGGRDGLDFYRKLLAVYPQMLKSGGMFVVEIGVTQEEAVCGIFRENGLTPRVEKDLCGVYRVVYSIK